MLFLISEMHEMLGKVPGKFKNTGMLYPLFFHPLLIESAPDPPGWMSKRLRHELYSEKWQEVDSIEGAVYTASFAGDPTSFTNYQLEIVNNGLAKWTIRAPTSAWYPGVHSGTLKLSTTGSYPSPYPFEPPSVRFESLLFSPYVSIGGPISTAILWHDWSPRYSLKDVLDVVAFMLVIEPIPIMFQDKRLPGIP